MSTRSPGGDLPVRRIDRLLTFMAIGLTVVSIACFFVIMIASAAGVGVTGSLWQTVALLPLIALPIAFLMIIAVLVMSFARRARANKGD